MPPPALLAAIMALLIATVFNEMPSFTAPKATTLNVSFLKCGS
jgi:hypothetical protein